MSKENEKSKELLDKAEKKEELEILKNENENLKKLNEDLKQEIERTRKINESLYLKLSNQVEEKKEDIEEEEKDPDLTEALKNIEEHNKKILQEKE